MRTALFAVIAICVASFLEVMVIPIPLALFALILFSVFVKKIWIFFCAIFAGFLLDSLLFSPLWYHALFYVCVVGIVFLYGRKFEIANNFFIGIMTVLSGFAYFLTFGFHNLFIQMIFVAFLPLFSLLGLALAQKIRMRMV